MSCELHHHSPYCGMLIAVFTLVSINVLVAEAAYSFQVTIDGFDNPEELLNGGSCCDPFCAGDCDPRFEDFCLREVTHTHDNTDSCGLGTKDMRVGLGDTITITSTEPWPNSFQIYFQVIEDDPFFDNFIGDVFADSMLTTSTDFVGPVNFPSENGHFTVDLSFRVSCQVDYYGPNCTVFCQGRDDTMGHYHCNETTGDIVCLSGYQNTTTDCTESICQTGCHQVGGYCDSPGECRCNAGWNGTLCDQCIPAEHCSPIGGYCTVPGECNCIAGFDGEFCNNTVPCASSPCASGTECVEGEGGSYLCVDIDDCIGVQCPGNSACIDGNNTYSCVCDEGSTGPDCTEIPGDGGEDRGRTSPSPPLIGGVVAAGVVMVALCTVAVLLLCWVVRRRKQLKHVAIVKKETLKAYQSDTLTRHSQPYPQKAYGNRTVSETIPTEENAAYGNRTVSETIPTEENAAYGNRTVGETIPTEENAAYGGKVVTFRHLPHSCTDQINEPIAVNEYDYVCVSKV